MRQGHKKQFTTPKGQTVTVSYTNAAKPVKPVKPERKAFVAGELSGQDLIKYINEMRPRTRDADETRAIMREKYSDRPKAQLAYAELLVDKRHKRGKDLKTICEAVTHAVNHAGKSVNIYKQARQIANSHSALNDLHDVINKAANLHLGKKRTKETQPTSMSDDPSIDQQHKRKNSFCAIAGRAAVNRKTEQITGVETNTGNWAYNPSKENTETVAPSLA